MSYTTKYYVNEEKRVVVCVIESNPYDAVNFIRKCGLYLAFIDALTMPERFVGIARCAPEDTYDEHIGKIIAFDRAKEKYDTTFIRTVGNIYDRELTQLRKLEHQLDKYIDKASQHHYKRKDEIEDYMNK